MKRPKQQKPSPAQRRHRRRACDDRHGCCDERHAAYTYVTSVTHGVTDVTPSPYISAFRDVESPRLHAESYFHGDASVT